MLPICVQAGYHGPLDFAGCSVELSNCLQSLQSGCMFSAFQEMLAHAHTYIHAVTRNTCMNIHALSSASAYARIVNAHWFPGTSACNAHASNQSDSQAGQNKFTMSCRVDHFDRFKPLTSWSPEEPQLFQCTGTHSIPWNKTGMCQLTGVDRPTVRPSDRPSIRPSDRPSTRPSDRPTDRPVGEAAGRLIGEVWVGGAPQRQNNTVQIM